MSEKKTLRCAVYTRKSSEEGLDQDFNSLEAQREACEAYVRSQSNEGWKVIGDRFDDGGFSGGNIQRPGLDSLMKLVREGRVDVIVIYKIDRLTRSLTDFAKLAETFDKHGVSFVSVTQQFNTTTSMGRLMLNVLLSFAQFEREITGERIRDKIAASKRKGMWMGGNPPMGYDVRERRLIVNEDADSVLRIFKLYLEEGTVPALLDRLNRERIKTPRRIAAQGRETGDKPFSRGHVYKLLTNPIYIGRVSHKGVVHPGQHEAIVDLSTWTAVQGRLTDNTQGARTRRRRAVQREYLLAGLLVSESGNRFVPTHATKGSRRYRYYVEEVPKDGEAPSHEALRLPAFEIEAAAVQAIGRFLQDGGELLRQLPDLPPHQAQLAVKAARAVSQRLGGHGDVSSNVVRSLVRRVVLRRETLGVELTGSGLRRALSVGQHSSELDTATNYCDVDEPDVGISAPIDVKRRGVQLKLLVDGERTDKAIDLPLVTAVARAHCWAQMLITGEARSIKAIADREGVGATYVSQLLPLGFISPAMVERALSGMHPADLTAEGLIRKVDPRLRWYGEDSMVDYRNRAARTGGPLLASSIAEE